jgi:hypothetical protein
VKLLFVKQHFQQMKISFTNPSTSLPLLLDLSINLNCCRTLFPIPVRQQLGKEMYSLADVDPMTRPFQLTIEEFGRLCQAYCDLCNRDPRLYKYNHRAATKEREYFDNMHEEEQDLTETVP